MTTAIAPPARRIAAGLEELIGNTPLVRISVADAAPGTEVLGKLESANPFASSKDRAALAMLRGAERRGDIRPGSTVVESTSGNTGIALAALCAVRGYRCVVVLPDSATPERMGLLAALGAEVVQTPSAERFAGAIAKAEEIQAATPGSWYVRQHENDDNVRAHYEATGPEIWRDTAGRVDVLVAGVGTGGTLTGGRALPARTQPGPGDRRRGAGELPPCSRAVTRGPTASRASTAASSPPTTDVALIDRVLTCPDEAALATARALTREQGIFAGVSSGAAVHGAAALARLPEYAGKTIVTILPDTGERYVSIFNEGVSS
ncbi:cysteine synthase A [Streptomyces goshikiensis]